MRGTPAACCFGCTCSTAIYDLQSADFLCLSDLQSAYQTAFGLYPLLFYKESALFLYRLYWLHQCGIPRHTCRFYCCLAAHQRTRKKDSAEPSFPILWTPPHPPGVIRCGGAFWLPRVWGNLVSCIQVQIAYRQFRIWFCFLCSGLGRLRFSRVVGLVSHVFHYWGDRSFVPAATWRFAFSFVGFALTATLYQFRCVQAHFTKYAG